MRIGQGFDVHAFNDGDYVMLGGVRIPYVRGVLAHSDGDVVIHALCDAIFGALALGDIGHHFPPSDARYRHADSRQFLRYADRLMKQHGYVLGNADMTVLAEAPKLSPYVGAMREQLAMELECRIERISVKATTTERLGFIGRGEGIAAQACVLLDQVQT